MKKDGIKEDYKKLEGVKKVSMIKDVIIIAILIIILSLFGALIIHILYANPKKILIETVWSGSELLGFYGSVLGGAITFFAVFITIKDGKNSRDEERKLNSRVYLSITTNIQFKNFDFFKEYANKIEAYQTYIYPQWIEYNDDIFKYSNEYDYIIEHNQSPESLGFSSTPRFVGFLVENAFTLPVLNFKFKIRFNIDNEEKEYGPVNINMYNPGKKSFFLIPSYKNKKTIYKEVNISYYTVENERIDYQLINTSNVTIEKYFINGREIHQRENDDHASSTGYFDIRKVMINEENDAKNEQPSFPMNF